MGSRGSLDHRDDPVEVGAVPVTDIADCFVTVDKIHEILPNRPGTAARMVFTDKMSVPICGLLFAVPTVASHSTDFAITPDIGSTGLAPTTGCS